MRSLWNDIALLWYEYKRQRSLHPRWRRLELIRAGLESLVAPDPMAELRANAEEIRAGFDRLRELRRGVDWLHDELTELDSFGGDPKE